MLKKPKKKSLKSLQNKADHLLQELGRKLNQNCEVCGREMSCLHHFWPKSMAAILRYNLKNCVALCAGCHIQHHSGNPSIHATVLEQRGEEWLQELVVIKRQYFKPSRSYYEDIIRKLKLLLE